MPDAAVGKEVTSQGCCGLQNLRNGTKSLSHLHNQSSRTPKNQTSIIHLSYVPPDITPQYLPHLCHPLRLVARLLSYSSYIRSILVEFIMSKPFPGCVVHNNIIEDFRIHGRTSKQFHNFEAHYRDDFNRRDITDMYNADIRDRHSKDC